MGYLSSRLARFHIQGSKSLCSVQKALFLGYGFYGKPWKPGTPGEAVSVVWSL